MIANRVNSDLVRQVQNIASRCAGFIGKRFDGRLGEAQDAADCAEFAAAWSEGRAPLRRNFTASAIQPRHAREIMAPGRPRQPVRRRPQTRGLARQARAEPA